MHSDFALEAYLFAESTNQVLYLTLFSWSKSSQWEGRVGLRIIVIRLRESDTIALKAGLGNMGWLFKVWVLAGHKGERFGFIYRLPGRALAGGGHVWHHITGEGDTRVLVRARLAQVVFNDTHNSCFSLFVLPKANGEIWFCWLWLTWIWLLWSSWNAGRELVYRYSSQFPNRSYLSSSNQWKPSYWAFSIIKDWLLCSIEL